MIWLSILLRSLRETARRPTYLVSLVGLPLVLMGVFGAALQDGPSAPSAAASHDSKSADAVGSLPNSIVTTSTSTSSTRAPTPTPTPTPSPVCSFWNAWCSADQESGASTGWPFQSGGRP